MDVALTIPDHLSEHILREPGCFSSSADLVPEHLDPVLPSLVFHEPRVKAVSGVLRLINHNMPYQAYETESSEEAEWENFTKT